MMKRFKFLGALFVGLISLLSFGYCGIFYTVTDVNHTNLQVNGYANLDLEPNYCYNASNFTSFYVYSGSVDTSNIIVNGVNTYNSYSTFCVNSSNYIFRNQGSSKGTLRKIAYVIDNFGSSCDCPSCPTCEEQYTSLECQQVYSLMPISSCDSEYCGLNGLCPEITGSVISELYINGINHLGAPIINISIPLEQAWDYEYTGDVMNINLSGENNVDYEYMDNIIRTQNSKPNTVDFNNIISVLLPKFIPGLVIILFILFVFRFIKKIF